jgi:hypothetical protein
MQASTQLFIAGIEQPLQHNAGHVNKQVVSKNLLLKTQFHCCWDDPLLGSEREQQYVAKHSKNLTSLQ